jgi:CubicO group peptidase (beta-lactamase class C family)
MLIESLDVQTWTYILVGLTFSLYIGIAIWSRASSTNEFYIAGSGVSPWANGMATAADWMSAASFIYTDCYELDKVNRNLAVGYDKNYTDNGIVFGNNIFMHVMRGGPQGGGYSTVEDLLKFDRALNENKLVGAEYVKMLTTAKPDLNSPNYGFGFQISSGGKGFGHSGGFPGINSNLEMFPETGWTAIVMSNYSGGGQPVIKKMRSLTAMYSGGK